MAIAKTKLTLECRHTRKIDTLNSYNDYAMCTRCKDMKKILKRENVK